MQAWSCALALHAYSARGAQGPAPAASRRRPTRAGARTRAGAGADAGRAAAARGVLPRAGRGLLAPGARLQGGLCCVVLVRAAAYAGGARPRASEGPVLLSARGWARLCCQGCAARECAARAMLSSAPSAAWRGCLVPRSQAGRRAVSTGAQPATAAGAQLRRARRSRRAPQTGRAAWWARCCARARCGSSACAGRACRRSCTPTRWRAWPRTWPRPTWSPRWRPRRPWPRWPRGSWSRTACAPACPRWSCRSVWDAGRGPERGRLRRPSR